MFEIFFISYQEPNADSNWDSFKSRFPISQRIHGVKGIFQAHQCAAKKSFTKMFWVVDGDAEVLNSFNFDYKLPVWGGTEYDSDCVHVWRSQNPVNDLIYGYGGVKLLPKFETINMDMSLPDMTTSISKNFKLMPEISNVTAFNTDPFNAWKSAFRECAKLSSRIIDRQKEDETAERLQVWCSIGKDRPFGEYAIAGALAGRQFGVTNRDNLEEFKKINDFTWLKIEYDKQA